MVAVSDVLGPNLTNAVRVEVGLHPGKSRTGQAKRMFKATETNFMVNAVEGGRLIQSNGDYRLPRINGIIDIIGDFQ
jgi:hypothetical protein